MEQANHSLSFVSMQTIRMNTGALLLSLLYNECLLNEWLMSLRSSFTEVRHPPSIFPCGSSTWRYIILILIQIYDHSDPLFSLFYKEQEHNLILWMWRFSSKKKRYNGRLDRQLWLRACSDLTGDQNLVPSTHIKQLVSESTEVDRF